MSEFNEKTGSFEGALGVEIFYRSFQASDEKARLVIAHGLGEHSGRYGNVLERLFPLGVSVWALDHRGHGQSKGKRGHLETFQHYLADLGVVLGMAHQDKPDGVKVFLLGHSMGGLIALNFAQNFPELISGVVASAPALGVTVEVPAAKAFLGKVMSTILPGLSMSNGLDDTKLSHDPAVVEAYRKDPLVHDRVTARWFTEFMSAMEATRQGASSMSVPLLMQLAGDDHLVSADAGRAMFEQVGSSDKTLHVYDGYYHEIYNAPQEKRAKVLDDLAGWMSARW
jgi:acylglycerol lipase